MQEIYEADVLVEMLESEARFTLVTPPDEEGEIEVRNNGRIIPSFGISRIRFVRRAGCGWAFCGFRYRPKGDDLPYGSVRSVEITGDELRWCLGRCQASRGWPASGTLAERVPCLL